jgi:hypothetical protein
MISQDRANEKRQALADQQRQMVQDEEQQNEELLQVPNQILELTRAIHAMIAARVAADPDPTGQRPVDELVAGVVIRCCILPQAQGPIRASANSGGLR